MKSGLDWFRIDVDFDDKFELVCAEFGSTAFEVIVRLWQKIYKEQGYYLEWNEEVALLFAKKFALGGNAVSEIVKCCIRRGIFDKELFEKYSILTSHGIQKWYFDSTDRRKEVKVIEQYLLVSVPLKKENVNKTVKNVDINAENVSKTQHSTVQNSTVQYIEKKSIKEKTDKPSDTHRFVPPNIEEVAAYCKERNNGVDAERFVDFYASKGWYVGKNKMRDWRAAVRTWERDDAKEAKTSKANSDYRRREYDEGELNALFDDLDEVEI